MAATAWSVPMLMSRLASSLRPLPRLTTRSAFPHGLAGERAGPNPLQRVLPFTGLQKVVESFLSQCEFSAMLMWNADASNGPRASRGRVDGRNETRWRAAWQAWRRTQLEAAETSVQLQSTNARTPPKTEEYQRPECKTIQQLAEPDEICTTSTPGSNPGGASKFIGSLTSLHTGHRGFRPMRS